MLTKSVFPQQRLCQLLRERSVERGDFVLASGKRSSFYIDARRTTMSGEGLALVGPLALERLDRKSTRLNSSHGYISYAVFCLKKKNTGTAGGPTDAATG